MFARKRRRWPWITLAVLTGGTLLVMGTIVVGGAQALLTPHHGMTTDAGGVIAIGNGEITLPKSKTTQRVGTYGLIWDTASGLDTGTATIGPVTATTKDSVTRPISDVVGELTAGTRVNLNPNVYNGDPQSSLGIPFATVGIEGELGTMPAWMVDGTSSTWVLFVHGIDGQQESALRPLPTLVNAGHPTLIISYRNDVGAPASPNGLISLGETEWHDLDAAAAYAVRNGAQKFILYGDSMGGSIVTQFMHQSEYAPQVVGMVLDSPVLNWSGVLAGQAERLHVGFLGGPLKAFVEWRGGIDLRVLNQLEQTGTFERLPILLFQGLADPLVPPKESEQFAASLSTAQYVPVPHAGHIQSWNVDPASYEQKLATFLSQFRD